jgi:hypothetical protein
VNILEDKIVKDVVVVGGGPAGVTAAVGAARTGADVMLVESQGFMGGTATLNGVPNFCPFTAEGGEPVVTQGVGKEILDTLHDAGGTGYRYGAFFNYYNWVPIDPEIYKVVLDDIVHGSGANVLFRTHFVDVEKEGDRIKHILVNTHRGLMKVEARAYIDCTGDGDLFAKCGVPYDMGDQNGDCMAPTMCFRLSNCSFTKFKKYLEESGDAPYIPDAVQRAKDNNDFNTPEGRSGGLMFYSETESGHNAGHVFQVDPLDVHDMSRAEREGRQYIQEWVRFLRKYVPGFEEARLIASGPLIGKRESRRMIGRDRVVMEDYLAVRKSPDDIARCAYYIDLHPSNLTKEQSEKIKIIREEKRHDIHRLPPGESYGIRYGCLLPKENASNLLVSGRCISTDRTVHASARVMPACFNLGHAAGVSAALCARDNVDPEEVSVEEVRKVLKEQQAYLPDDFNEGEAA